MVLDSTAIPIDTCVAIITRAAQDVFTKFEASRRRRELDS
jgi:hypothetical protein